MTPRRLVILNALVGAALVGAALVGAGTAAAAPAADRGCAVLAGRLDAVPGGGPAFLGSFDDAADPALRTAAFTYDNALAAIALVACGDVPRAQRIGEALVLAAIADRAGQDGGRLRNAYRAGAQTAPPPPNGWWDTARGQWLEDDYQVGTATGNVAWAALALLTLHHETAEPRYLEAAAGLAAWVVRHAADSRAPAGFTGGIHGGEARPRPLTWKSTEHNVDLDAVFRWLARAGAPGAWADHAGTARGFVAALFEDGRFLTGTGPDGVTPNRATSGLDAQLWPQLLPDAPAAWRRAVAAAQASHGVPGGYSFNDDRHGLWTEGTAQAALVHRHLGDEATAARLLATVRAQRTPGGYLRATPQDRLRTGLAIGPDSTEADFFYYPLPHLGATAWAVLAAEGWNPFTGRRVGSAAQASTDSRD